MSNGAFQELTLSTTVEYIKNKNKTQMKGVTQDNYRISCNPCFCVFTSPVSDRVKISNEYLEVHDCSIK